MSGSRLSPRSKNPKISGILKFKYIFHFFRTELTSNNPKTLPIEFLVKKWWIDNVKIEELKAAFSAQLHYSYSNMPHRSPAAAARWCQATLSRNWWCLIQAVARLSTAIQRRKKKDLRCQTPIYCYGLDILRPLFDLLILNISYTTFKRLNWKNCGIKIHKWQHTFNELLIINLLLQAILSA